MARVFNLFISHSWSYGDDYDRFVKLLRERPYFEYKDFSVPKDDPIHNAPNKSALYAAIKQQMSPCHVVIIMGGKYSTFSDSINMEIEIAQKEFSTKKPILGVRPFGAEQVSSVVSSNCDRLVNWNTDSIVDAIRDISI
jgi:hypothetical protein